MDEDTGDRAAGRARQSRNLFRLEGELWTIAFAGRVVRLRATRGLVYLAQLLSRPGVAIAADLIADSGAPDEAHINRSSDPRTRERARVAVTKSIAVALRRIAAEHPELGRHLQATVRRGYVCVYLPDPRVPIRWRL